MSDMPYFARRLSCLALVAVAACESPTQPEPPVVPAAPAAISTLSTTDALQGLVFLYQAGIQYYEWGLLDQAQVYAFVDPVVRAYYHMAGSHPDDARQALDELIAVVQGLSSSGDLPEQVCVAIIDLVLSVRSVTQQQTAGAAPLFSDGFESGGLWSSANGFQWNSGKDVSVSNAVPRSGARSLAFVFGPDAPSEDSFSEQRFSFPATGRIWIEYWLYVPTNYRHRRELPDNNNKFFRLFSAPDDGTFSLTLETIASADPRVSSTDRFKSESGGARGFPYETEQTPSVIGPDASYPIQIGRWTRIRIHFRSASSASAADGRVEVRANDRLVKALDWDFWPTRGSGPVRIDRGYLLGWSNSGFSEQTTLYIDDFKLWTSDPGW